LGILPVAAKGVFGNGLYFASSLAHLNSVAHGGDNQVYLISLVLPGNPFPLSELALGAGCRPGYQSHFVTMEGAKSGESAGELVIFDPSQALPLFMWTTRGPPQTQFQEKPSALRKEWNFTLDETWHRECQIPVLENGERKDEDMCAMLDTLLSLLGGGMQMIRRAYWINNPLLVNQFEVFLDCHRARRQLNLTHFVSREWETSPIDVELKKRFMVKLDQQLLGASKVFGTSDVMPVIQGTHENAHRIAKNGFGTVATLDPGFFGQGIYFTSKLSYARKYAKPAKDGSLVLVISLASPGNVLPVTADPFTATMHPNPQGYLGKPRQQGYQSHYTVVYMKEEGGTYGYPLRSAPPRPPGMSWWSLSLPRPFPYF